MNKVLEVRNLHVKFHTAEGVFHAVRGIDFFMFEGETLGIVGESGCGKTATAKALVQLNPRSNAKLVGEVLYQGENLLSFSEKKNARNPR